MPASGRSYPRLTDSNGPHGWSGLVARESAKADAELKPSALGVSQVCPGKRRNPAETQLKAAKQTQKTL